MRVILAGATGLVGGMALKQLLKKPGVELVATITRRPVETGGPKHSAIIAPMEEWAAAVEKQPCDVGICCLGTTIKAAGSKDAFAAVDLVAVQAFAQACRKSGARQFIMVTSVGADPKSGNFYLATKGKAEIAACAAGFERVDIMRPGLLVGTRSGPTRVGERLAIAISPFTDLITPNVLSRYRSIPAECVAKAIAGITGATEHGIFRHHNDDMRAIQSNSD